MSRRGAAQAFLLGHVDAPHAEDDPCVVWPFAVSNGYGMVRHRGVMRHAHTVVAELRDGPAPEGTEAIHGQCHNRLCIVHVRWGTRVENMSDKLRDGTHNRGERHGNARLSDSDVATIRTMLTDGVRQRTVAGWFGVNPSTISLIASGRRRA